MNRSERDALPGSGGRGTLLAVAHFESIRANDGDRTFDSEGALSLSKRNLHGSLCLVAAPPVVSTGLRYHGWRRYLKRAFDVGVVVIAAPIVVPVLLALAVIVKLTSRGPVFFAHERVGEHAKPFRMLKFRTMYMDAGDRLRADTDLYERYIENDFKLAIDEDPRIAPFGKFLRRSSLDELPQLLNVLTGRMSLVGPRPVVEDELARYGPWVDAYLEARPGITGRWQTDGRNHVRYPERAMLDAEYLENWTFWSDLVILIKTIPTVLRGHGSH